MNQYPILNDDQTCYFIDCLNQIDSIDRHDCLPINYLPEENSGRLKMDLLYDQNGLIDLILNNEISYIEDNSIYKDLAKWPNISAVC